MFRHSSAHLRHPSAHCLQCCASYFSHSCAHASQTSAQSAQSRAAKSLPRDINRTARAQISAQSRSSSMHRAIFFTSCSCRHSDAQCSHAIVQAIHAWIQRWYFSCGIIVPFYLLRRSEPGLSPALHLLDLFLLILRNLRGELLQLGASALLFHLLGHFHCHVVMLWHHLKEGLVEVGIMFVAQHRHMHFHLLVRGLVGDGLR